MMISFLMVLMYNSIMDDPTDVNVITNELELTQLNQNDEFV